MAKIEAITVLCRNCKAQGNQCDCNAGTYRLISWHCDRCEREIVTSGGRDVECLDCGACYNGFGQRLRDNWRSNPSVYDDEIGDMEGYELQHANDW